MKIRLVEFFLDAPAALPLRLSLDADADVAVDVAGDQGHFHVLLVVLLTLLRLGGRLVVAGVEDQLCQAEQGAKAVGDPRLHHQGKNQGQLN